MPLIAVSPLAPRSYVSHAIADHSSLLAFIDQRCLTADGRTRHLTARDANASTLEDLFDFDGAPSRDVAIPALVVMGADARDMRARLAPFAERKIPIVGWHVGPHPGAV